MSIVYRKLGGALILIPIGSPPCFNADKSHLSRNHFENIKSAGDKIIRRSPRKLPEAAVNAVDPATGVIPYSFACTIANTQGVIPHGLTERHFVSYRPAKKRASNHWCEELLNSLQRESSGNLPSSGSGRDSGLDSAEEEAIRRIFGEKKRETKRRSSPKKEGGSQTGSQAGNEGTPTKKLKKKTSTDGTSSGDSGRETPTSSEPKEISLKEWLKYKACENLSRYKTSKKSQIQVREGT